MSEKSRHDKDGEDQNKANRAMREHQQTGQVPGEGRHISDAEKLAALDRADFDRDLRPHEGSGQNNMENNGQSNTRNAYDLKELHEKFPQLSNADLKQLAILPLGAKLEQGATYIDLSRLEEGEFKARADFQITETNLLVAKNSVDHELWDRLRGHGERVEQPGNAASAPADHSSDDTPNDQTSVDEAAVGT